MKLAHRNSVTMCMGLGCNAVGVTGCRIIDSRRERLASILTNALVPCNGRFPALLAIISMFLVTDGGVSVALLLFALILCGIVMTFVLTKILTMTFLRGEPSAFALELPPFRTPNFGSIAVRSVFDRTLFVLGRSVSVAAPAGLVIWLLANLSFGGTTLLASASSFFDPFGMLLGVDGVFILALILGLPANEIVLSVALMCYTHGGALVSFDSLEGFRSILQANGWDVRMAVCALILMLFHFPCATTLLTVRREAGGVKWMLLAALLPMLAGALLSTFVNFLFWIW